MRWTYTCPDCRAVLNPQHSVMLKAVHGSTKVLAGFHPQPGNYEVFFSSKPNEGEVWEFFCPVCQSNLAVEGQANLCALDYRRGDDWKRVIFSSVAGEKATFVVNADGVTESFGEDAVNYPELMEI